MYMLALKHIGRHRLHEKFPDLWEKTKCDLECLLQEFAVCKAVKNGLHRKFIVRALHDHLVPFVCMETVSRIEKALEASHTPVADDVLHVATTKIGAELYKAHVATMQYKQFDLGCQERPKSLEHNDYVEGETKGLSSFQL